MKGMNRIGLEKEEDLDGTQRPERDLSYYYFKAQLNFKFENSTR